MLKLIQLAEVDACGGLLPIVRILRKGVMPILFTLIPIALIMYAAIDLGKAVIASDEKEVKAAQSRLIKRLIYALLIFCIPFLISAFMDLVGKGGTGNTEGWNECWETAGK